MRRGVLESRSTARAAKRDGSISGDEDYAPIRSSPLYGSSEDQTHERGEGWFGVARCGSASASRRGGAGEVRVGIGGGGVLRSLGDSRWTAPTK
jgi:hypothetical protein